MSLEEIWFSYKKKANERKKNVADKVLFSCINMSFLKNSFEFWASFVVDCLGWPICLIWCIVYIKSRHWFLTGIVLECIGTRTKLWLLHIHFCIARTNTSNFVQHKCLIDQHFARLLCHVFFSLLFTWKGSTYAINFIALLRSIRFGSTSIIKFFWWMQQPCVCVSVCVCESIAIYNRNIDLYIYVFIKIFIHHQLL